MTTNILGRATPRPPPPSARTHDQTTTDTSGEEDDSDSSLELVLYRLPPTKVPRSQWHQPGKTSSSAAESHGSMIPTGTTWSSDILTTTGTGNPTRRPRGRPKKVAIVLNGSELNDEKTPSESPPDPELKLTYEEVTQGKKGEITRKKRIDFFKQHLLTHNTQGTNVIPTDTIKDIESGGDVTMEEVQKDSRHNEPLMEVVGTLESLDLSQFDEMTPINGTMMSSTSVVTASSIAAASGSSTTSTPELRPTPQRHSTHLPMNQTATAATPSSASTVMNGSSSSPSTPGALRFGARGGIIGRPRKRRPDELEQLQLTTGPNCGASDSVGSGGGGREQIVLPYQDHLRVECRTCGMRFAKKSAGYYRHMKNHFRQLRRASLDQEHKHGEELTQSQMRVEEELRAERERVAIQAAKVVRTKFVSRRPQTRHQEVEMTNVDEVGPSSKINEIDVQSTHTTSIPTKHSNLQCHRCLKRFSLLCGMRTHQRTCRGVAHLEAKEAEPDVDKQPPSESHSNKRRRIVVFTNDVTGEDGGYEDEDEGDENEEDENMNSGERGKSQSMKDGQNLAEFSRTQQPRRRHRHRKAHGPRFGDCPFCGETFYSRTRYYVHKRDCSRRTKGIDASGISKLIRRRSADELTNESTSVTESTMVKPLTIRRAQSEPMLYQSSDSSMDESGTASDESDSEQSDALVKIPPRLTFSIPIQPPRRTSALDLLCNMASANSPPAQPTPTSFTSTTPVHFTFTPPMGPSIPTTKRTLQSFSTLSSFTERLMAPIITPTPIHMTRGASQQVSTPSVSLDISSGTSTAQSSIEVMPTLSLNTPISSPAKQRLVNTMRPRSCPTCEKLWPAITEYNYQSHVCVCGAHTSGSVEKKTKGQTSSAQKTSGHSSATSTTPATLSSESSTTEAHTPSFSLRPRKIDLGSSTTAATASTITASITTKSPVKSVASTSISSLFDAPKQPQATPSISESLASTATAKSSSSLIDRRCKGCDEIFRVKETSRISLCDTCYKRQQEFSSKFTSLPPVSTSDSGYQTASTAAASTLANHRSTSSPVPMELVNDGPERPCTPSATATTPQSRPRRMTAAKRSSLMEMSTDEDEFEDEPISTRSSKIQSENDHSSALPSSTTSNTTKGTSLSTTYQCKVCQIFFNSALALEVHQRTQANEDPTKRPCKCTVCPHRFTSDLMMRRHRRLHNKSTPSTSAKTMLTASTQQAPLKEVAAAEVKPDSTSTKQSRTTKTKLPTSTTTSAMILFQCRIGDYVETEFAMDEDETDADIYYPYFVRIEGFNSDRTEYQLSWFYSMDNMIREGWQTMKDLEAVNFTSTDLAECPIVNIQKVDSFRAKAKLDRDLRKEAKFILSEVKDSQYLKLTRKEFKKRISFTKVLTDSDEDDHKEEKKQESPSKRSRTTKTQINRTSTSSTSTTPNESAAGPSPPTQQCEICHLSFHVLQGGLARHRTSHANDASYPVPCTMCPHRFISDCMMKRHRVRHTSPVSTDSSMSSTTPTTSTKKPQAKSNKRSATVMEHTDDSSTPMEDTIVSSATSSSSSQSSAVNKKQKLCHASSQPVTMESAAAFSSSARLNQLTLPSVPSPAFPKPITNSLFASPPPVYAAGRHFGSFHPMDQLESTARTMSTNLRSTSGFPLPTLPPILPAATTSAYRFFSNLFHSSTANPK